MSLCDQSSYWVLRFLSKWRLSKGIFVQVNIVQVNIIQVTLLSKWHFCPSDIIVQVTLLSKWILSMWHYCPSARIILFCKNLSKKSLKLSRICQLDKIFQFISKYQIELKWYSIILMISKNKHVHIATWVNHTKLTWGNMEAQIICIVFRLVLKDE